MIIPSCSHSSVVKVRCKWTGGSTVEVNIEIEKFTVVCSLCRQNLEIRKIHVAVLQTTPKNYTKCVPHMQHACFFSFDSFFLFYLLFCQNTNVNNFILDEVFVISRIIKVEVRVISRKFILLGPPQF